MTFRGTVVDNYYLSPTVGHRPDTVRLVRLAVATTSVSYSCRRRRRLLVTLAFAVIVVLGDYLIRDLSLIIILLIIIILYSSSYY